MKKLTFEISDDSYNLLIKIGDGCAEYRDSEFLNLEKFKESEIFLSGLRTEEWFLNRNFGGTLFLIQELVDLGLACEDNDSWHLTYVLTDFGKTIFNAVKI